MMKLKRYIGLAYTRDSLRKREEWVDLTVDNNSFGFKMKLYPLQESKSFKLLADVLPNYVSSF